MTKIIVITGASRGLGFAMTEQFIQLGHTVLGCTRTQKLYKSYSRSLAHLIILQP
jgi:NAD(P)-dependent dehydrogenase (short-subunit alcohol dehydrogenase family)